MAETTLFNEQEEDQLALLSILQELTVAALELFTPERPIDCFLERIAERLGCSAVLCFEYRADHAQITLLGDAGLSQSSREMRSISVPKTIQHKEQIHQAFIEKLLTLPYREVNEDGAFRWCFQLDHPDQWGAEKAIYVLLCFANQPVLNHRYQGMMERALYSFKAALLQRETYAKMLFQNALLESQNEASIEGIIISSPEGKAISFNRKFVEMWGFQEEIASRSVNTLLEKIAQQLKEPEAFLEKMSELHPIQADTMACLEIHSVVGKIFECCRAPVKNSAEYYGLGFYFRDITEQKRAEEKLVQLLNYEQELRCQAQNAERRNALLAEVSRQLESSAFDIERMQQVFVQLMVPILADYSFFYEYHDHTISIARIKAVGHLDERKAKSVLDHLKLSESAGQLTTIAFFSKETHPLVNPSLPENSSLQSVLKEIGCRSLMIAPLKIHENIFGFACLVFNRPDLQYNESDQAFVSELTDRASLMFENALLYRSTQQALRHRDAFLAVASHELRTPVTSVRAVAQLLIQQIASNPDRSTHQIARMAKILDEQSDRLTRLVGQLLDVTQIELGKLKVTRKEVELSSMVQTIAEAARVRYPNFTFNVRTSGPVTADVDPIRLEQVVVNLVENAIRYAQEGRKIDIEVSATDPEGFCISVRDYGKGIPEDLRGRLFQRFERAKKDEFSSGLGMGLFISKQIIEMHGGTLRVESPPSGGAKFIITAPISSVVRMPLQKSA